jgi:hypothetical protein
MPLGPYGKKDEKVEIPMLQIEDLYKGRRTRDTARLKAYNKLLEQIYHKIRVTSEMPTHPDNLLYTIPSFIFGLPRLDLQDCVVYLVYQLRTAGFKVQYSYPNLLNISWRHYEQYYLMDNNPILQAMLATKEVAPEPINTSIVGFKGSPMPSSQKKQLGGDRKVRFDDTPTTGYPFGRQQPTANSIVERPLQKSFDDYQPPAGFFTAIERPTSSVGAIPSAMGGTSRGGMGSSGSGSSSSGSAASSDIFKGLWS